jgi:glycerate 2-kinase
VEVELINHSALEMIWRAGVARAGGHTAVSGALKDTQIAKPDAIIAVGKAATPMLEAALAYSGYDTKSLLITKYDHVVCRHKANQARLEEYQNNGTLQVIEAGHPVPDENSMSAGRTLMQFVETMDSDSHLLFLVSGGASALVELPANNDSLEKLQEITNQMLAQGLDIAAINKRRKQLSLIKGGKLLGKFAGKKLTILAISDVEGDGIGLIGSGIAMTNKVSDHVEATTQIIASNKIARDACAQKARMLGFGICENAETAYGDVEEVAKNIVERVKNGAEGVYIFGGEPTVVLPPNPGRGGRNQQLALLMAGMLAMQSGIELLVAGTDGSDGPGDAAGGFADGASFNSVAGGRDALAAADAGNFLAKSGNLFVTGPTGTNVMDLIIAIKE